MMAVRLPSRCRMRISRATSWRSAASRLESGSSSSSTFGLMASARARATRCCCPPESWRGSRSAYASSLTSRSISSDAGGDLVARTAPHLEAEGDIARHGEMGEQRVALEDDAHLAAMRGQVADGGAVEQDVAAAGRHEAADHAQRRRLAAAGRAEQHDHFALRDLQRDGIDGSLAAVLFRQRAEREMGHRSTAPRRTARSASTSAAPITTICATARAATSGSTWYCR